MRAKSGDPMHPTAPIHERESEIHSVGVDDDLDLGSIRDVPHYVPPQDGAITVEALLSYVKAAPGCFLGRWRLFIWFSIVEPAEHHGGLVYLACPMPENTQVDSKTKKIMKAAPWGQGSAFAQAWMVASGHWPTRLDRMTLRMFRGKYFRAELRTVKTDQHGKARPPTMWYSKIVRLIEVAAGGTTACVSKNGKF